ncbi:MAG: ATP-dependent DNA helicase RecG [Spirochaetales bacterium]|nr:ATP-dependent DNA helicase RecG [Spirochaetales bacterium]
MSNLAGIGPQGVKSLSNLGIVSIARLLRHFPVRYEDRVTAVPLGQSSAHQPAVTEATVLRHENFRWKKGMALKVIVEDGSAVASMLCFGRNFLASKLPPGKTIRLAGPFEHNRFGELQSGAFVFEDAESPPGDEFDTILPIYHLGGSLTQKQLRKAISNALETYAHSLREELPVSLRHHNAFLSQKDAIWRIHCPASLAQAQEARQTLIYQELFHMQIAVGRQALSLRGAEMSQRPWDQQLHKQLREALPFSLTKDQESALDDIQSDLHRPHPMSRLLQGEVGSGKTLVAFMAALGVIGAGRQAAFMAPTELLARQHADNAAKLLEPLNVKVAFLTGDVGGSQRTALTQALAQGEVDLVIGTHALFASDVTFKDLALVIVDEQHRFGVDQRKALADKGHRPDVLSLTATPIPRTLALTAFGDMDVSSIRTLPAGRLPIETHLARMGNEAKVYDFVRSELKSGNRAYFVYPLIEESEKSELKDAEGMFFHLTGEIFPEFRGALIHSRIDEEDKRRIMNDFRAGDLDFLVATSVVEVGVDVKEATCMVVEHAERFGLSALHQLRGRVGRGEAQSYCFLVYATPPDR